ncbi:FAD-dependent oxidoreductase [Mycobacterium sp.]|uniref:FAD-dependent oxidoreductase n=1 Tax=Mycobacterium sp. TaxID=1785 RepID=UPI0025D480EC|nr:FAD-dependent oxidoreductase [Mycobacterium sp.]MBW0012737.1 FAD-dependent oxidoreductase [Mycobacterium sp.]
MTESVVVLGGGLSGCSASYVLAQAGLRVSVIERAPALGGLGGSFERDGHFYPLGYHHILRRDRTLLYFLELIGALEQVQWRRIRMLFRVGGQVYNLAKPVDLLRFPLPIADKASFVGLMLRAYRKTDWTDWLDKSAEDLLDSWSRRRVREVLFEPLTQLKFELPCSQVSGAWLGARLHYREGSAALGYIPGTNWTHVLCQGVTKLLQESGVDVRLRTSVTKLHSRGGRLHEVELDTGECLPADLVVSSIPTPVYLDLAPDDATPHLREIRYSALLSMVCASKKAVEPDFYWMNLADRDRAACGIFLLNSLNPTIGAPGDSCVNFVTHLNSRTQPFFAKPEGEIVRSYLQDFKAVFGFDLDPFWVKLSRVPMYSPVITPNYRNPPICSTRFDNVYFAGNYRTFPSVVSTGTALTSGVEAARTVLRGLGTDTQLPEKVAAFRH